MSGPWEDYKETSEQGPWEDYPSPIKSKKIEKLEGFEGGIRAALVSLARNLTFGKSDEIAASILGLSEKEAKEYKKAADHLIKNHPKIDTAADVAAMAVPGGAAIKGAKLAGKGLKKVLKDVPESALKAVEKVPKKRPPLGETITKSLTSKGALGAAAAGTLMGGPGTGAAAYKSVVGFQIATKQLQPYVKKVVEAIFRKGGDKADKLKKAMEGGNIKQIREITGTKKGKILKSEPKSDFEQIQSTVKKDI